MRVRKSYFPNNLFWTPVTNTNKGDFRRPGKNHKISVSGGGGGGRGGDSSKGLGSGGSNNDGGASQSPYS